MDMSPVNYYDMIEDTNYRNPNPLAPQHPFRMSVVGESGSGKTNQVMNIIMRWCVFDAIHIYAKDLEEDLYTFFHNQIELANQLLEEEEKDPIEYELSTMCNINIDDVDTDKQRIIIFDDFVNEKNQEEIKKLFIRGRKKNCSVIYISQTFFDIPPMIRSNCSYFLIYPIEDCDKLRAICRKYSGFRSYDEMKKIFDDVAAEPYQFVVLDKKTQDKRLKIRKGWNQILKYYN